MGDAAMFCTAVMAADLPKEGTYSGTYSSFGTIKSTSIGKERLLLVFDEHGVTLSGGFLDQMTWHCWGLADFPNGMDAAAHGNCVGIDAAGDQISGDFLQEKHKIDAKDLRSSFTFTAGTGKFAGLSGGFTYVGNLLRTADEGTYGFISTFRAVTNSRDQLTVKSGSRWGVLECFLTRAICSSIVRQARADSRLIAISRKV